MRYGTVEFEPFATALVEDPSFRAWVLRRTKFSEFADARILNDETPDCQPAASRKPTRGIAK